MNQTILTKESSTAEIRRYFTAVLKLSQSDQEFPVNLDQVFPLVYNKKSDAVDVLSKTFIQDVDYQVLRQNPQNPNGGRPKVDYLLSVPCMEFFIARKVRPVFEVYRQVFHKAVHKSEKAINSDNVNKLKKEIELLQHHLKWARITQQQETELKNSCFLFLIGKGLCTEYHEWLKMHITSDVIRNIMKSIDI